MWGGFNRRATERRHSGWIRLRMTWFSAFQKVNGLSRDLNLKQKWHFYTDVQSCFLRHVLRIQHSGPSAMSVLCLWKTEVCRLAVGACQQEQASVVRRLYQLCLKMGCFSSSREAGRSEGCSSRQRRVTSRRPGDRWGGMPGAVVALAIWGTSQWESQCLAPFITF